MFIQEWNFARRELGGGDVSSSCHFNFLFLNDRSLPFKKEVCWVRALPLWWCEVNKGMPPAPLMELRSPTSDMGWVVLSL